ncbi:MAG: AraC family transcriptional regulator [Proteobacteria bacterium]|nr:AraC family transcriptional regulator [Pseudomonadota bacterium]
MFLTQGPIFSNVILYAYSVSYVIAGLYLVIKYRINLAQQKVDIEGIDLKWLIIMSYCQVVIWIIALSQWLLPFHNGNNWAIYVAVSLWVILTGYLSLSQQNLPIIKELKSNDKHENWQNNGQENGQENDERFDEVGIRLNELIEHKNIHLQPSLTIGNLAKSSGYPEYLISLFINRVHAMNFRDYINKLRIKEAKKLLLENNKQTVLDVAYECGYNSKSTFNSAFKKITGQTPSQFRQAKR